MLTDLRATDPSPSPRDAFTLRRRPPSERFVDLGFRQLTLVLASMVAIVLLGIFLTVFQGAREAIAQFGLNFLTTSGWDPVNYCPNQKTTRRQMRRRAVSFRSATKRSRPSMTRSGPI